MSVSVLMSVCKLGDRIVSPHDMNLTSVQKSSLFIPGFVYFRLSEVSGLNVELFVFKRKFLSIDQISSCKAKIDK